MTDMYRNSTEEPAQYTHYAWTDAGVEPKNPGGFAAVATILKNSDGSVVFSDSTYLGNGPHISNNWAEHYAMADLLWIVGNRCYRGDAVLVRSDSMLVVKQLCGRWRVRNGLYKSQYERAMRNLERCRDLGIVIDVQWVPRELNEEADSLVRKEFKRYGVTPTTYKKKKVKR